MYIVMHNTTVDQNNIHLHVVMKICHKHDKCTSKYWHYTCTCTWTSIKVDIPVHVVYSIQVKLFWNVNSIKCHVRIICRICSLQCSKLYTMSITYAGESQMWKVKKVEWENMNYLPYIFLVSVMWAWLSIQCLHSEAVL
jgi:hypothetical protein